MKILDKLLSFANTLAGDYYGKDKKTATDTKEKPKLRIQRTDNYGREL